MILMPMLSIHPNKWRHVGEDRQKGRSHRNTCKEPLPFRPGDAIGIRAQWIFAQDPEAMAAYSVIGIHRLLTLGPYLFEGGQ